MSDKNPAKPLSPSGITSGLLLMQERVGLALEMALDRFAMVESLLRQGPEKSLEYLRSSGISPREEKHILESKDPAKLRDRLMKTVMYHIRPVAGIGYKSRLYVLDCIPLPCFLGRGRHIAVRWLRVVSFFLVLLLLAVS